MATAFLALFSAQASTGQSTSAATVQDDSVAAVSGCAAVVGTRICELSAGSERELRVWLPQLSDEYARLLVQLDGRKVSAFRVTPSEHGYRLTIPIELTRDRAQLSVFIDHRSILQLDLRRAGEWPWQREPAGALRPATAALRDRLPLARGAERSKLLRALAQTEVAAGRLEPALRLFEEGARGAEEQQRHSDARGHWLQRAYHQAHAHDFGAARASVAHADQVSSAAFVDADGRAAASYVRGVLAAQMRDLRGAQAAYEEAQRWVNRGATLMRPQLAVAQAFVAEQQGRLGDAVAILERELEADLAKSSPCFHAIVLTNLGWYELLRGLTEGRSSVSAPRAQQR
ncbi:MAG TPA: hypothetical protein VFQ61_03750, partial [Polyangiaceae bacterium]|nr:hypothetical protein [Polyangiaceae bacterium]